MSSVSTNKTVLPWHSPEFHRQVHAEAAGKVHFIEHRGNDILLVDFSGADLDLVKAVAAETLHVNLRQPPRSLRSLVDIKDISFHPEAIRIGSELNDRCEAYALRTAVIGATGFRIFMLQTIINASKRPIRLFADRELALDWLVHGD